MRLDDYDLKLLTSLEKITMADYGIKRYPDGKSGYIEKDDVIVMLENLQDEIINRDERIEDLENDIANNYKPISQAEQYEVSDRDFI